MAKSLLIGRHRERADLELMLESGRPELVALYGRRRVGKTFLIRQFIEARGGSYLEVTGTKGGSQAAQLRHFRDAVSAAFVGGALLPEFADWESALAYLVELVERRAKEKPRQAIVLFFDELPWLSTPRSRLLEAMDYHWNARLSRLPQVKTVLCGSAASWMLRRIVHAKGGLHNRITRRIRLEPFRLADTEEYLRANGIRLKSREVLELYMAIGGVPYYLSLIERGRSVAEIVGRLCFEQAAPLRTEFQDVFASLFDHHQDHVAILRALATKREGLTRDEVIAETRLPSGGSLNRRLEELEEAGFIASLQPYGAKVKNTVHRVIDEYALFYLRWIERAPRGTLSRGGAAYWLGKAQSPSYRSWAGYAFESVCLKHALELQRALGIEHVVDAVGSWARPGAQIDLVIDRRDGVINLCEMKFGVEPFVVTKAYARELKQKLEIFEQRTKTRKRLLLTLVSPAGLKRNVWSDGLIDQVVDAEAFRRT